MLPDHHISLKVSFQGTRHHGTEVEVRLGVLLGEAIVALGVGLMGVKVGRGVGVLLGVGIWYQRGVEVGVRVGGTTAVGVMSISGG